MNLDTFDLVDQFLMQYVCEQNFHYNYDNRMWEIKSGFSLKKV